MLSMLRTIPPFRADMVGSLLRPAELKEARAKHEAGQISDPDLKEVADADFLAGLDGVEMYHSGQGIKFKGADTKPKSIRVNGKIGFSTHPMIDHFKFLKAHVTQTPKVTIPSPSVLHFRGGRKAVPVELYPDMDGFYNDLGLAYKKAVRAFADAGSRYLQLDETN